MKVEIEITDAMFDEVLKYELETQIEHCDDEKVVLACKVLWDFYGFERKA